MKPKTKRESWLLFELKEAKCKTYYSTTNRCGQKSRKFLKKQISKARRQNEKR